MSTMMSVFGGVGLFLLAISVMTRAASSHWSGSEVRTTLSTAASDSVVGTFWGAFDPVSVGLLSFSQGLVLARTSCASENVIEHVPSTHLRRPMRQIPLP